MQAETTTATLAGAWAHTLARLPEFTGAVLTGLDAQGYPYSVRCRPEPDATSRTLRMPVAPGTLIEPGPASLLCHRHDERLWNQRSFLVRGVLEREGSRWTFQPRQYVEGVGYGGMQGMARFVIEARRATRAYLARRGLPRPSIPWDEIAAVKQQATLPHRRRATGPALAAAAALVALVVVIAGISTRRKRGVQGR